jgi:hypothetical protein
MELGTGIGIESLEERRAEVDMVLLYKVVHKQCNVGGKNWPRALLQVSLRSAVSTVPRFLYTLLRTCTLPMISGSSFCSLVRNRLSSFSLYTMYSMTLPMMISESSFCILVRKRLSSSLSMLHLLYTMYSMTLPMMISGSSFCRLVRNRLSSSLSVLHLSVHNVLNDLTYDDIRIQFL